MPTEIGGGGGGGSVGATPYVYATGRYYGPVVAQSASGTLTNNLLSVMPLVVPEAKTLDRIGIHVTSPIAATVIRLGIYSTTSALPDALVLDAGTIDSSTGGGKEITISQALTPGLYWLAAAAQGGAPASLIASTGHMPAIGATGVQDWSAQYRGYSRASVTGALPSTFGAPTLISSAPIVVVRAA